MALSGHLHHVGKAQVREVCDTLHFSVLLVSVLKEMSYILSFCLVKCSAGRFKEGSTCKNCKKGTYQAKEGMTTCDQCPSGTTTLQEGSKQSSDCLRK